MILFINACVRERSRTMRLARALIEKIGESVEEVRLEEIDFPASDEAFLRRRDKLLAEKRYSDPMFALANQFKRADVIVIAAPYWDLSFPAALKQYIEQINAVGVTFRYTEDGVPEGLCRAKKLYYVSTAGGTYVPNEFGFGYVKALAEGFYGISEVACVCAAGLDIYGADPEAILREAIDALDASLSYDQGKGVQARDV